jgi:hypothetical protein
VTLYAQAKGGAMATVEEFPWGVRLANALTSYCWYLEKLFVPTKLAVFYPSFATQPPLTSVLAAAAILASVTLLSLTLASRRPSFLVGWLWFLGTLVPVIGFVQIGGQSMADRYSYIPSIGILLLIVWCVPDRFAVPAWSRRLLAGLAGGLVAACGLATLHQLSYWKDGIRLFRHALAVTQDNWVAHANLAAELAKTSTSASSAEFRETVLILARFAETYNRKGVELEGDPRHLAEAIKEFRIAIQIFPGLADAHFNLGTALMKTKGDPREAVEEFRTATKLKPDYLNAHLRLAVALSRIPGGDEEAKAELRVAIGQAPNSSLAHYLLGVLLYRDAANRGEAMAELRVALFIDPDFKPAQDALRRYQGN